MDPLVTFTNFYLAPITCLKSRRMIAYHPLIGGHVYNSFENEETGIELANGSHRQRPNWVNFWFWWSPLVFCSLFWGTIPHPHLGHTLRRPGLLGKASLWWMVWTIRGVKFAQNLPLAISLELSFHPNPRIRLSVCVCVCHQKTPSNTLSTD